MDVKVTLDKKRLWMFSAALVFLAICIFAAGWLSGVIFSRPPATPSPKPVEDDSGVVRQNVPEQPAPVAAPAAAAPVQSSRAASMVKRPALKALNQAVPQIGAVRKQVAAVKKVKTAARPLTQPAAAKSPADPAADGGGTGGDTTAAESAGSETAAETGSEATAAPTDVQSQEPSTATEAEPEPDSGGEPEGVYPYSLRLGSFRDLKGAEKALAEYQAKGLAPHVVKVDLGDQDIWFRVYSGFYGSQQDAMADRDRYGLDQVEIIRTRWANRIGVYEDEAGADSAVDRLMSGGHHPYVVRSETGRFIVYLGAFLTRKGAEAQHETLVREGIESQVIQR